MPTSIQQCAEMFAQSDIFYPSSVPGFWCWGPTGLGLLNRVRLLVKNALEAVGYREIGLPSVCARERLERFAGAKSDRIVGVNFNSGQELALVPFSELVYLDYLVSTGQTANGGSGSIKNFQWSRCCVREVQDSFFDFNEYVKCEIFSLHHNRTEVDETQKELHAILKKFCEEQLLAAALFGTRPAFTAFPGAQTTFAAELTVAPSSCLTLLVSHVMEKSFIKQNGFKAATDSVLCSSCFSQKMLAAILVHHADSFGLRLPPALAPCVGIVLCSPAHRPSGALTHKLGQKRIAFLEPAGAPRWQLIQSGAAWLIQESSEGWELRRRCDPEGPPTRFPSMERSLEDAMDGLSSYAMRMQVESRSRMQREMVSFTSAEQLRDFRHLSEKLETVCMPCCAVQGCQQKLAGRVGWIPKLQFEMPDQARCLSCQRPTRSNLLFEQQEMYTSFYAPHK